MKINHKVIEINGVIEVQKEITHTEFLNEFVTFLESKGWYFGGGTAAFIEDEEGNTIKVDE